MITLVVPFLIKCAWGIAIIDTAATASGLK
jgi:hypothetical protein